MNLTTKQIEEINRNGYTSAMKRAAQRNSEVARIATELQKKVPGLTRTDALMAAEDIVKEKQS